MTKQQHRADSVIHEDQLRNFLVNALTGAFGISVAGNGDIDPADIHEGLVGATADGTSISTLCKRSEESDSGNDFRYHLRTKLDLDTVRSVGNTLLGLVDDFDFDVKAVSVDREFSDGKCLTLMQADNHSYVMPIVKWEPKIQTELSKGWSREIEHDLTTDSLGSYRPRTPAFAVAPLSSSAATSRRLDSSHS